MEKQLTEVETGLLHLQQNIDIPDIQLTPNAAIVEAMERSKDKSVKAQAQEIFEARGDSQAFLNSLQKTVNSWVGSIQKVHCSFHRCYEHLSVYR